MANMYGDSTVRFVQGGHADEATAAQLVARRWRLVFICELIGAAAAGILCHLLPVRYASSVTLMLDPLNEQRRDMNVGSSTLMPPSEEMVRKNEMALIGSRQLAERVIEDLGLERDPEFNPVLRTPSAMKATLRHAQHVM